MIHVEPPTEVLAGLVALRIHFDDTTADNGALAVVPASHLRGSCATPTWPRCGPSSRSSPAVSPSHRRVLHVVYASEEPGPHVRWKRAV